MGGGVRCAILGCPNRTVVSKVSFFQIPGVVSNQGLEGKELSTERRQLWIKRINQENVSADLESETASNYHRKKSGNLVCEAHFVSKKPCFLFDRFNPDWAPSLNLGHDKYKYTTSSYNRWQRIRGRRLKAMNTLGTGNDKKNGHQRCTRTIEESVTLPMSQGPMVNTMDVVFKAERITDFKCEELSNCASTEAFTQQSEIKTDPENVEFSDFCCQVDVDKINACVQTILTVDDTNQL